MSIQYLGLFGLGALLGYKMIKKDQISDNAEKQQKLLDTRFGGNDKPTALFAQKDGFMFGGSVNAPSDPFGPFGSSGIGYNDNGYNDNKESCSQKILPSLQNYGNHVHQLEDWQLVPGIYATSVESGHAHTIELDGQDIDRLTRGEIVKKRTSINGGHDHEIIISC